VTYQRLLLRLLSSDSLGRTGRRFLHDRVWTIEAGEGAGLKLNLPQNFDFITGSSEIPVQKALARRLGPGGVFYDIGANIGFFSLIAARIIGESGRVYSFEPVIEHAATLRKNAQLNGLENITVFEVAVGRNSRIDELLLTTCEGGSAISTSSVKPSAPVSRRMIQVAPLDDLIPAGNLRLPSFVKIDVEGVEFEVVQGMTNTITTSKPVLLYEIDDGDKTSFVRRWKELDEYVSLLGYDIVHLEDSYPDLAWNVGHSLALPREAS